MVAEASDRRRRTRRLTGRVHAEGAQDSHAHADESALPNENRSIHAPKRAKDRNLIVRDSCHPK